MTAQTICIEYPPRSRNPKPEARSPKPQSLKVPKPFTTTKTDTVKSIILRATTQNIRSLLRSPVMRFTWNPRRKCFTWNKNRQQSWKTALFHVKHTKIKPWTPSCKISLQEEACRVRSSYLPSWIWERAKTAYVFKGKTERAAGAHSLWTVKQRRINLLYAMSSTYSAENNEFLAMSGRKFD